MKVCPICKITMDDKWIPLNAYLLFLNPNIYLIFCSRRCSDEWKSYEAVEITPKTFVST